MMSKREAYEALSSASRLQILKWLYRKPLGVKEIAELTNLKPITVRHHLQSLKKVGFIESYEEKRGTAGRPKVYYQIAKEPTVVVYPKRGYQDLCSFLIATLQLLIGPKRVEELLRRVGGNMGKSVINELESKHDIKEWSREAFIDFFVKGYLEKAGSEPTIVETDKNRVVYNVHNCLFLELSVKMPEIMCDVLHDAFHKAVSSAMGGKVEIIRLASKGHGDPNCKHEVKWHPSPQ